MQYAQKKSFAQWLFGEVFKVVHFIYPNMLFVIFLLFFGLAVYLINDQSYRDFGMNFLSEIAGIFVTVYVVELFYRGLDNIKKVPARTIIWKELAKSFDQYFLLWKAAYEKVGISVDNTVEDVFDEKIFLQMMKKLDLDAYVDEEGTQTWCTLINKTVGKSVHQINEMVRLHYNMLDPQLMHQLDEFVDGDFNGSLLELHNLKELRNTKDSTFHSISLKPHADYFENVVSIYHWIMIEQHKLRRLSKEKSLSTAYRISVWES